MKLNSFAKSVIGAAVLAAAATSAVAAPGQTKIANWLGNSSVTTFIHSQESGSFFDTLNFTVPTSGTLSSSAVSIDLQDYAQPGMSFQITGLSGAVWGPGYHPCGACSQLGTVTGNNTTFNFGLLSAGQYHIDFTGTLTGNDGGAYLAALHLAPVPEPETYAMLLAGLGLMGGIARRRNNKAA